MNQFERAYASLNTHQREAVDNIDGPLLVIAGPGTGKTQLLSARVAHILQKTDTPPRNILCLTFTENGAENMRERLSRFVGSAAYDVTISTYHAFGGDFIRRYPESFTDTRLQNPVDELGRRQIIADIVERMPYGNPLKQTSHHEGDLISTISEIKRALLSATDLRLVAAENLQWIYAVARGIEPLFRDFTRMPRADQAIPLFEKLLVKLGEQAPKIPILPAYGSLAQSAILTLRIALDEALGSNKTTSLTTWKNDWMVRSDDNQLVFGGERENQRVAALADVLEQYQTALAQRGLYDFDDMISRTIDVLEKNDGLRQTIQEQYLYILLDEFQDTNRAQLKLVQLLTDNPVYEGRPNVMAVGDDDQAIYAFQGALFSNMLDFLSMYRDVRVINLTENYRSHGTILAVAARVAAQINERLYGQFAGASKTLIAANHDLPEQAFIERREFQSDIAQADWTAGRIKALVASGVKPGSIAVLAPRHRQLEPLIPYINALKLPVRYEKRENILEAQVVKQLITMSRLVLALHNRDEATADSLWPEVLSYDFWQFSPSSIWELSWRIADEQRNASRSKTSANVSWSRTLLSDTGRFRIPALLFLTLAHMVNQETGETMLDYLTGSIVLDTNEPDLPRIFSPLRDYYTGESIRRDQPELFYETLSHLTVLRARLRDHQNASEGALTLQDLINFVDMYAAADEKMINTSPYTQAADAVQVMTVFKAKGLEFDHVFLVSLQDDVWGGTSRGQSNRITLPSNLIPIRHAGVTDDERLRILYVAMTRARSGLYLTSVARNYNGKTTTRLKYLQEQETPTGDIEDLVLPEENRIVRRDDHLPPKLALLELDWRKRHIASLQHIDLRAVLEPRLADYRLSPTHLSDFLDLQYGGPAHFFFNSILHFPSAPTVDGQFGNAIHETLQWVQEQVTATGTVPTTSEALVYFAARMRAKKLTEGRTSLEIERGERALSAFLTARKSQFQPGDKAEVSFRNQGVVIGGAQLAGKVDRLEIDYAHKRITVVDYKTGKSYAKWTNDAKLYKYSRQLYSYKIVVEHSITYRAFTVTGGRLEFVEPDNSGRINTLDLSFKEAEVARTKLLMEALWNHVKNGNFPSVADYESNLAGIKKFEQDLIDGSI